MATSSKSLESFSKFIYYTISFILCVFLIMLSSKLMSDMDNFSAYPEFSQFLDSSKIKAINQRMAKHNAVQSTLDSKMADISRTIQITKEQRLNEKESFNNWLKTRNTVGLPSQDKEVIERTKKLDDFYAIEQQWKEKYEVVKAQYDSVGQLVYREDLALQKENEAAEQKREIAQRKYDLQVFLYRLLFVLPILALGIFFFVKYRTHKFWPLFLGFSWFSIYAFFFGLVPYLPSYGGYIRYGVGITLTLGLGYYAIGKLRDFIAKRNAEMQKATQERAKKIQLETAEKSLDKHFCPSCGKDFLIKNWDKPISPNNPEQMKTLYERVADYCRYCGLQLFKECSNCSHKNFAHLPYCFNCGSGINKE